MTDELVEREVAAEQAFVDRVYAQMEHAASAAAELAREGHSRGRLGHEGGLVERDAMVFQAAKRIAQLDAAHEGLVFGRLDMDAALDPAPRYVGRIGLRDGDRNSLLIDWRAPAAAVFYQATAADPQQVLRRRVLRSAGRSVVGVEDELLDAEGLAAAEEQGRELPIIGEGALMAQLSRARDRSMHSIVATIQAEQDKAIRAPSRGVVSISGGPGTGKTVVALHRAAYLLYSDRQRYERGGVLVVGPSGVFMRYIERVLPSLGETAVALRSLGEVVNEVRATRHDEPAVADVKGSARMAELMRRLARQQAPGSPTEFRVFWRDDRLVLDRGKLGQIRRQLMSQGMRNKQVPRVAQALLDALWRQVRGERGREQGRERFNDDMLSRPDFLEFAAAWWPPLDAPAVLCWLREGELLARIADGLLSGEEQRLLAKSWSTLDPNRPISPQISIEDVPLLDELRYALGDVPARTEDERDDPMALIEGAVDINELMTAADREFSSGRGWRPPTNSIEDDGYAHVLIDEAQDLTPMQWRMVGRRGRTASWTIVGDPAQSSWPEPAEAAAARAEALDRKQVHEFHLSTNYRNSAEIYAHAAAYAQRVGLDADLPDAVRRTGAEPKDVVLGPGAGSAQLEAATREAVLELAGAVSGTVGIVVPVARRSEVNAWLASWPELAQDAPGARAAAVDSATTPSGEDRVVVLTGLDTKGLEFDGIVVVRPQEIEDESATGRATLYVVLTRATQLLTTIS
ncbi:AAA family ATPase [Nocardioides sp. zg-536]|uniref:AAA family ATPase n=1 Tax=Nocardioides faecalis TaxID=2803858 RepID=A0A938Y9P7_9ACTN|nr:UvrD-helicase domain-containing protein [Nocardioides faecalis]MBM9459829.1 AAA family ATPase [Nocardioides faecalis]MBS4754460.1 AAA family ATPase [Nocardioides faecalis]QVI58930.1 AAA family ATPase [Nocardioides faecalis]